MTGRVGIGAGGAVQLQKNLRVNNEGVQRSLERLSTGKRINRPSDDPSGFVAAEELRGEIDRLNGELRSVAYERAASRQQQSSMGYLSNRLNDLRGQLTSSAGNVFSDAERQSLDAQIGESLAAIELQRTQGAQGGPTIAPLPLNAGSVTQEMIDDRLDEAVFSQASLAAYEQYDLDMRQTLAEDMLVTHSEALSQIEDADFAEETANLALSRALAESSTLAISLSGKLAAEQVGTLIDGVQQTTAEIAEAL